MQEIGGVVPDDVLSRLVASLGIEVASPAKAGDEDDEMNGSEGSRKKLKTAKASKAGDFDTVRKEVERIVREGFSASQILTQLHDLLILDPLLSSKTKSGIALALGEADKCLNDGSDEELQILNMCVRIKEAVKKGQ